MLNINLFLRYFLISTLAIGLILFLSSFSITSRLDEDVLKYTNQFRKSNGLTALVMRDDLNEIARKYSEDMARGRCGFGHSGFDKRNRHISKLFSTCTIAENVAYGSRSGKEVVTMWKNSSGHRSNMLGNYKYIGIGTAKNSRGTIYYTQIFVKK